MDALELGNYWGCYGEDRRYHHTGPVLLVYSLREALAAVVREGIDRSVKRHQDNAKVLHEQLKNAGFKLFVEDEVSFKVISAFISVFRRSVCHV